MVSTWVATSVRYPSHHGLPSASLAPFHLPNPLPLSLQTFPLPLTLTPYPTPYPTYPRSLTFTHTHTCAPSFCDQVFTVDYLLRFWCAGEEGKYAGVWGRVKFTFSFFSLVDLVSIVRTYY